jgi:hypothetical protein
MNGVPNGILYDALSCGTCVYRFFSRHWRISTTTCRVIRGQGNKIEESSFECFPDAFTIMEESCAPAYVHLCPGHVTIGNVWGVVVCQGISGREECLENTGRDGKAEASI